MPELFSGNPTPRNVVVVIAEDEELIRVNIAAFLRDTGFNVIEASNATAALKIIAAERVDLLITDINMPGEMKGDVLAQLLLTQRPGLPVILTSGATTPLIKNTNRRFLAKPYELSEVELHVRELLH